MLARLRTQQDVLKCVIDFRTCLKRVYETA